MSTLPSVDPQPPTTAAFLARIRVYPFKSLDPLDVESVRVLPTGALELDRRFAFVDPQGNFINGKRRPRLHAIRCTYEPATDALSVVHPRSGERHTFRITADAPELCRMMGEILGEPVRLIEEAATGMPDDCERPGPTVISTGTIRAVADWFQGLDEEEIRRRFRANLEIGGVPPFWEDRWCAERPVRFRIGDVPFDGLNACQRCAVPARSSNTGESWPDFAARFRERRLGALPAWSTLRPDDHGYRLAVNTRLATASAGGIVCVGDAVS